MFPIAAVTSLFSGSGAWRKVALILAGVLLVAVLMGVVGWKAWHAGYAKAEALGAAELAQVREAHAAAEARARAEALGMYDAAMAAGYAAERDYLDRVRRLSAENRDLNRRISDDAQAAHGRDGGPCVFDPAFVRHVNAALGLGGDRSLPGAAPGAPGGDPAPGAAAAGVLPGQPWVDEVTTPEDLLAFLGEYGSWARQQDAQLKALQQWARLSREVRP